MPAAICRTYSKGGNDTFTGAFFSTNTFFGDAGGNMSDHAQGGDDRYTDLGGAIPSKTLYGDAGGDLSGFAAGGNDNFTSAGGSEITFYGDAGGSMFDHALGGDDVAVLHGTHNLGYGDAVTMLGSAVGGNDTLTGGDKSAFPDVLNELYGDAFAMSESATGGNDILTGGQNSESGQVRNFLCGDALQMSGSALGGNDTLYAGSAAPGCTVINDMWGDGQLSELAQGGRDQFIFKDDGSMTVGTQNTIYDFSQTQGDTIVFSGVEGVQSFDDLTIAQSGTDTIITAGVDQVTLANFTSSLTTSDFLFV
ncbi:hypothetical protein NKH56_04825 [Mesorhizobium sp. M1076]|uniref:hypothetical protein n=1 Tax=Mesorhizobium sp. M1076 TaxID=2957054 RepID=UPI0033352316